LILVRYQFDNAFALSILLQNQASKLVDRSGFIGRRSGCGTWLISEIDCSTPWPYVDRGLTISRDRFACCSRAEAAGKASAGRKNNLRAGRILVRLGARFWVTVGRLLLI
jgi:hypothetical protein